MQLHNIVFTNGLQWTDEFSEGEVSQVSKRTLAGTMVTYHSQLSGGINITLESQSDNGWIKRSELEALKALAKIPGLVMDLIIRGTTYKVLFRHQDKALEAAPVFPTGKLPLQSDYYLVKIRLITV